MGLIRDALGSALGANQVNNGFSGPISRLPFGKNSHYDWLSPSTYQQSPKYASRGYSSYNNYDEERNSMSSDKIQYQRNGPSGSRRSCNDSRYQNPRQQRYDDEYQYSDQPPRYEGLSRDVYQEQSYNGPSCDMNRGDMRSPRDSNFHPIALPQIAYGDEQPFLRGYTYDLNQYGISEQQFIGLLDAINVAIIPNPENQIFQKGANIAGWFLPGAASIGLTLGQIGVGLGTSLGHASSVARILSTANLQLFLPKGLEICIGKTEDVNNEVGLAPGSQQPRSLALSPEERRAYFGNLIAPLSRVLPPLQQSGRSDPIAMLGRGLASRTNQKKMEKAEKEMAKGKKTKHADSLEGGLKWLIVRQASADALTYWRNSAASSVPQVQVQARSVSQKGYYDSRSSQAGPSGLSRPVEMSSDDY